VQQKIGAEKTQGFMRLYMVPGMGHPSGGPGPNSFGQSGHTTAKGPAHGVYTALEEWVEKGTAPGEIIATKYIDDAKAKGVKMTRPLCAYPQVAKYKGSGDTNDSANFACSAAWE
jgi:feruloyl esterase